MGDGLRTQTNGGCRQQVCLPLATEAIGRTHCQPVRAVPLHHVPRLPRSPVQDNQHPGDNCQSTDH